jgi:hypothetical protein
MHKNFVHLVSLYTYYNEVYYKNFALMARH